MQGNSNENTPDAVEKAKGKRGKRGPKRSDLHVHNHTHHYGGGDCEPSQYALTEGYQDGIVPDRAKGAREWSQSAECVPAQNPGVAVEHPDLEQSNTVFGRVLYTLRANPYSAVGQTGFHSVFSGTDSPAGSPGNSVTVHGFDPAAMSGEMRGAHGDILDQVDHRINVRTAYDTAPTGSSHNGTHRLNDVESRAVANKSRLDIMKEAMYGGGA